VRALGAVLVLFTATASASPKPVTRVLIKKEEHTLTLFARDEIVRTFRVAIGPGGAGPKKREGDMVTPVGRYRITMQQPSQYRTFLRLDYPTPDDWKRFNAIKSDLPPGARIGGDIGIHGPPVQLPDEVKAQLKAHDWTAGCIAVDDDEIREIARLVRVGTPVDIED
jgi:murein L,D-transpeptidase YafK